MLKTAIIGITGYGAEHLRLLTRGVQLGYLSAEAAVVINPEQAVEKVRFLNSIGCRIYGSVETLWDEERGNIDLCMIPTAISTHYSFARQAVECGANVLLEKPACATLQDTRDLDARTRQLGRKICIGFQDIYSSQVQLIKDWLVSGRFGRVLHLRGGGCWPRQRSYFSRNGWAGRLQDANGWVLDSPVNNAMAHFLNLMLFWGGQTQKAYAGLETICADLYRVQEIESFDTATIRIGLSSGADILFAVTHSCQKCIEPVITIVCERGTIQWTHAGPLRYSLNGESHVVSQSWMHVVRDTMMDHICKHMIHDGEDVCELADTMAHTACVNALHQFFPIHNLSDEFKQVKNEGPQGLVHVPGIEAIIQSAIGEGKMLRDLQPAWIQAGLDPVSISSYAAFSGPFQMSSSRTAPNAG